MLARKERNGYCVCDLSRVSFAWPCSVSCCCCKLFFLNGLLVNCQPQTQIVHLILMPKMQDSFSTSSVHRHLIKCDQLESCDFQKYHHIFEQRRLHEYFFSLVTFISKTKIYVKRCAVADYAFTCWFGSLSESIVDLSEVEHHRQLIDLLARGKVTGRHDGCDAKLLLENVEGQLVVVCGIIFIQSGHVSAKGKKKHPLGKKQMVLLGPCEHYKILV